MRSSNISLPITSKSSVKQKDKSFGTNISSGQLIESPMFTSTNKSRTVNDPDMSDIDYRLQNLEIFLQNIS